MIHFGGIQHSGSKLKDAVGDAGEYWWGDNGGGVFGLGKEGIGGGGGVIVVSGGY